jgi:electron transport complex protein RnfG
MSATAVADRTREPAQNAPEVSPLRLVATLAIAGALAGLLLVTVYQWTQPAIQAHKAQVLRAAVLEVLAGPQTYQTLYVVDNALTADPPGGADLQSLEAVYLGLGADGRPDGFAVPAGKPGFQDIVSVIFGYDPSTGALRGMKVLANKETPGLGDRIEKDSAFTGQFVGATVPLVGVKPGRGTGNDDEIDTITGATISSRTVIVAINEALERVRPLLDAYHPEDVR